MYNNDYENLIKGYLRQHQDWKTYTENLLKRMVDLRARLRLQAAPKTTHFGYEGGGSGGWVNPAPRKQHVSGRKKTKRCCSGCRKSI